MSDVRLDLSAGLDRSIAWYRGGSVRYLVADLAAGGAPAGRAAPPLNIALCIDVSGSMGGDKIVAAREAALAVAASLTARDRLSVVAFANQAEVLLDARAMDAEGQAAAAVAIHRLQAHGGTNLFEGWLQAAERVASAAALAPGATPRVLILSDGHANQGLVNPTEVAVHVGALLERGVLTSTLGIGDGYDENLLGTIARGRRRQLHDAAGGREITEVLGELREAAPPCSSASRCASWCLRGCAPRSSALAGARSGRAGSHRRQPGPEQTVASSCACTARPATPARRSSSPSRPTGSGPTGRARSSCPRRRSSSISGTAAPTRPSPAIGSGRSPSSTPGRPRSYAPPSP